MALPKWFTPVRMLVIFTSMSLLVYLDRGMIASTGVNGVPGTSETKARGIQGDFNLSNFQNGCLPAAFMVGLMVAAPIFAEQSKHTDAFRLVGVGLGIWMVAVMSCGFSWDFWSLMACRCLVGVGEASFVVLAAPFIDEYAPAHVKSLWLAIFYMAIPVGYAAGYIYGGLVGYAFGWRAAFVSEAFLMLPFVVFAFRTNPIPIRSDNVGSAREEEPLLGTGVTETSPEALAPNVREHSDLFQDLAVLAREPVFVIAIMGNTVHTAILGMYSYWGPKAITFMFAPLPGADADLMFGVLTVVTGIFGTLAGGVWLDRLGSKASSASAICLVAVAGGFLVIQTAFMFCYSLPVFMAVFAVGEFLLFMLQAPLTSLILLTVPPKVLPLAFSVQTISIHVFGDVPSPPFAGWLHDHVFQKDDKAYPESWRSTVIAFNFLFILAITLFVIDTVLTWHTDYPARVGMLGRRRSSFLSRGRARFANLRRLRPSWVARDLDTVQEGFTPTSPPGSAASLPDSSSR